MIHFKLDNVCFMQVTRVVLLWVNNHFNDFEENSSMTQFLEDFGKLLDEAVRLSFINVTNAVFLKSSVIMKSRDIHMNVGPYVMLDSID